ncbi:MAG: hypothetical protein ACYCWE_20295 [Eubacteriales bacterium]
MLKLWDKQTNLIFPNGAPRTPEQVYAEYPWARYVGVAVNTGVVTTCIENMEILRDIYKIDESLTDTEALTAIQIIKDTVVEPEPSAEERIAASLEFQNMMML